MAGPTCSPTWILRQARGGPPIWMARHLPAAGQPYDRELHPEKWPQHSDGPFVLLFHDRDISLQHDFVERTFNALPKDTMTLSMTHYVGILHAQVTSASEGIEFGFQYEEP